MNVTALGCMTAQVAYEMNFQNAQGAAGLQTAIAVEGSYVDKY